MEFFQRGRVIAVPNLFCWIFFLNMQNLRSNYELIHIQNEALLDPFLPELWVCWLLLCIAASLDVKWILEILNCQKRSNKDCQKSKFVLSWNHKVFHHYTASLNNLHLQSNIFGFLKVKYFHISIWRIYSYSLCEHNPIILKSNDTLSFRTALQGQYRYSSRNLAHGSWNFWYLIEVQTILEKCVVFFSLKRS